MKATEKITEWLQEMVNTFSWIYFRYEYSIREEAHLICVYPKDGVYSSPEYCKIEMAFNEKMDYLFPNEPVLFSTENELFSCSDDARLFMKRPVIEQYNSKNIMEFRYPDLFDVEDLDESDDYMSYAA